MVLLIKASLNCLDDDLHLIGTVKINVRVAVIFIVNIMFQFNHAVEF